MSNTIYIKNMVCQRCISSVASILGDAGIGYTNVRLGEADLSQIPEESVLRVLKNSLEENGFQLIEKRATKIIESIKLCIADYINLGIEAQHVKLSSFITSKVHYDYSYLSDLFSSVEGKTIEQYFIMQRIEKVKELLVYDEKTLTEISYDTGFSSVHHLSAQFKKVTGLTPSHFKKLGAAKRKAIDSI